MQTQEKTPRKNTKHIYAHRYTPQNIGAEKEQMRDVFLREDSLFPYQSRNLVPSLNPEHESLAKAKVVA